MADEEKKVEETAPTDGTTEDTSSKTVTKKATDAASAVKDNVFSMFGGGTKTAKKEDDAEEDNDRSGSAKAQKEKAAAEGEGEDEKAEEDEADVHFEPVVHLTEKVETKTRRVMRRDKTLKVCANHYGRSHCCVICIVDEC